jgi:hypothetical protein
MIIGNQKLTEKEFNIGNSLHNKRLEYLIQLGEIKLAELENERRLEEVYTNIIELNTKENLFQQDMFNKYGKGQVDLVNQVYVRNV